MLRPEEYLKILNIEVAKEVIPLIKTNWDLDCILDAVYIFDTYTIDKETFLKAQEVVHNYFNGNLDEDDEFKELDLSSSLATEFSHYIKMKYPKTQKLWKLILMEIPDIMNYLINNQVFLLSTFYSTVNCQMRIL